MREHTVGMVLYSCGACGRGFWISVNLHHFQEEHSAEKPFLCREGRKHILEHHDVQYQAPREVNSCRSPDTGQPSHPAPITGHSSLHTVQKPFKCGDCGKCFLKASALLDHLVACPTERPLQCLAGRNALKENSIHSNHQQFHSYKTHVFEE